MFIEGARASTIFEFDFSLDGDDAENEDDDEDADEDDEDKSYNSNNQALENINCSQKKRKTMLTCCKS